MNFRITFSILLLASLTPLFAQKGFQAAALLGLNFAQIDGDDLFGYNKVGLHGGLRASYEIKPKMDVALELLFSQRGSSTRLSFGIIEGAESISLQFIEIPVLFVLRDWLQEPDDYYKVRAEAGLSYGNLFNASSTNSFFDDRVDDFNNLDISFIFGLGYQINKNVGVSARYTRAFNRLFSDPDTLVRSLVSYFLTFRTEYNF